MSARDTSGSAPHHSHPHNNTMSRNKKFWVDQVTVPPPPRGTTRGGERQRGGGGYYQTIRQPVLIFLVVTIFGGFAELPITAPDHFLSRSPLFFCDSFPLHYPIPLKYDYFRSTGGMIMPCQSVFQAQIQN